jgi:hypothetical protein
MVTFACHQKSKKTIDWLSDGSNKRVEKEQWRKTDSNYLCNRIRIEHLFKQTTTDMNIGIRLFHRSISFAFALFSDKGRRQRQRWSSIENECATSPWYLKSREKEKIYVTIALLVKNNNDSIYYQSAMLHQDTCDMTMTVFVALSDSIRIDTNENWWIIERQNEIRREQDSRWRQHLQRSSRYQHRANSFRLRIYLFLLHEILVDNQARYDNEHRFSELHIAFCLFSNGTWLFIMFAIIMRVYRITFVDVAND